MYVVCIVRCLRGLAAFFPQKFIIHQCAIVWALFYKFYTFCHLSNFFLLNGLSATFVHINRGDTCQVFSCLNTSKACTRFFREFRKSFQLFQQFFPELRINPAYIYLFESKNATELLACVHFVWFFCCVYDCSVDKTRENDIRHRYKYTPMFMIARRKKTTPTILHIY